MAKDFSELTKGFSEERRAEIDAMKDELRQDINLAELRQALKLTRQSLADFASLLPPKPPKGSKYVVAEDEEENLPE